MTTEPNVFMKSLEALGSIFRRHPDKETPRLLPRRNPFQIFRSGHGEIHDPKYLERILSAELESQQNNPSSAEESTR